MYYEALMVIYLSNKMHQLK